MVYLLFICIAIIFVLSYLITRDLFNPAVLFIMAFLFSSFFGIVSMHRYDVDISFKTVVVLIFFILCFVVPCIFISKTPYKYSSCSKKIFCIDLNYFFVLFMFAFLLIVMIFQYQYILNSAYLAGYKGGINNIFTYSQKTLYDDQIENNMGFFLNYGLKISKAFGYLSTYVIIQNFINKRKINKVLFLNFLIYLVQCILSTGRTKLTYFIIFSLAIYILLYKTSYTEIKKTKKKLFIVSLITVAILIVSFLLFGTYLRGSIYGTNTSMMDSLCIYSGGPIFCFDIYLNNPSYSSFFGEETLYSIYGILNKIGFDYSVDFSYLEFVNYGNTTVISNNVYTAFRRYIHDYSSIAGIIVMLEGFLFGYIYRIIKTKGCNSFVHIFYSSSLFAVLFYFFEERFLIDVLSTSNLLSMFIFYLCYRISKKTYVYSYDLIKIT